MKPFIIFWSCVLLVSLSLYAGIVLGESSLTTSQSISQPLFVPSEQQWREYIREIEKIRSALETIAENSKK